MSSPNVQDKAKEVIAFYTQKLEDMGLTVKMGAEIEFLALGDPLELDGTEATLKEEVPHVGHFKREWKCGIVDDDKGESHQFELPGVRQYEVVTEVGSPVQIADAIRKSRDYFERLGNPNVTVDFGPRPVQDTEPYLEGAELPEGLKEPYEIYEKVSGNGLHLNISLWNREGQNVFFDPASTGESETFRAAAAGVLEFVQKGGTLPYAGEVDSYERLGDEDYDAPARAEFSVLKHGGGILRTSPYSEDVLRDGIKDETGEQIDQAYGDINGYFEPRDPNGSNFRMEVRLADAEADPHVATACTLAAIYNGLVKHKGISQGALEAMTGSLPESLEEATAAFKKSEYVKGAIGDSLHEMLSAQAERKLANAQSIPPAAVVEQITGGTEIGAARGQAFSR